MDDSPPLDDTSPEGSPFRRGPTKSVSPVVLSRMDDLVELVLAHPCAEAGELAALSGRRRSWVSRMLHSTAFQQKLAERRQELAPDLSLTVQDRMRALVLDAAEELHDRIPSATTDQLTTMMSVAGRNLGLGVARGAAVQVNINNDPRRMTDDELEAIVRRDASRTLEHEGG